MAYLTNTLILMRLAQAVGSFLTIRQLGCPQNVHFVSSWSCINFNSEMRDWVSIYIPVPVQSRNTVNFLNATYKLITAKKLKAFFLPVVNNEEVSALLINYYV